MFQICLFREIYWVVGFRTRNMTVAILKPFKALRPLPEYARKVASVPYDVVKEREARALAEGNAASFLHVTRSEIDLAEGIDPYCDAVYEKARANLLSLISQGVLVQEQTPSLFVYRLVREGREQTGIVACSSVDDYDAGVIKIHEKTRPDKELDRTRHILRTRAHTGPVFLAFRTSDEISNLIQETVAESPLCDFTADDGVRHVLWRAADSEALVRAFLKIENTYIADGHHRAASAAAVRRELKAKNPKHTGEEGYNFFLTVAFPHHELRILPYNRIIRKLDKSVDTIFEELCKHYLVKPNANATPNKAGEISMFIADKWYGLELAADTTSLSPVDALDASTLFRFALNPVFGIRDPRTDHNLDFVGGIRGTKELEKLVRSGDAECAFSLYPVSIDTLLDVADCGMTMPPKSTWFEPKLRCGMITHSFEV